MISAVLLRELIYSINALNQDELIVLLRIAADRARAFDASAGNHALRAASALSQDGDDRRPPAPAG